LTKQVIITASHCGLGDWDIYVGSNDWRLASKSNTYKAKGVAVVNNAFHDGWWRHDVMLVITERDIEFNENVGPICVPKVGEIKEGMKGTAIGYGVNWAFQDMFFKYNLLQQNQTTDMGNLVYDAAIEQIYETYKEIIPNIDNIFYKDMKKNKKIVDIDDSEIAELAVQNLKKLETSLLPKITDSVDREKFEKYYPKIFKKIIRQKYETPEDLSALAGKISQKESGDHVQYTPIQILSNQDCEDKLKNMHSNPHAFCVKSTGGGFTCPGDSGGPLAVKIDNKYYIGGVLKGGASPDGYPIECLCECYNKFDELTRYSKLDDDRKLLIDALKNNGLQLPPGLEG